MPVTAIGLVAQRRTRGRHLRRDRPARRVGGGRVAPQIAHRAAPRAFAPREQHGGDPRAASVRSPLVLDDEPLVAPGIVRGPRTPPLEDEAIARRPGSGIETRRQPYKRSNAWR